MSDPITVDHIHVSQVFSYIATVVGAVGGVSGLVAIMKAARLYGALSKSVEILEKDVPELTAKINTMSNSLSSICAVCENRGDSCSRTFNEIKESFARVDAKANKNAEEIVAAEGRNLKEMIKEINSLMGNSLAKSISDIKEVFKKK